MIEKMGRQAREAARVVATASTATKNDALEAMAASLEASAEEILAANAGDVAQAQTLEIGDALMDRLSLTDALVIHVKVEIVELGVVISHHAAHVEDAFFSVYFNNGESAGSGSCS